MKVLALQADRAGCGWYRIVAPAKAMRAAGRDVSVSESLDTRVAPLGDGSVLVAEVTADCDRLVFQRPVTQRMYAAAVQAREQGYGVTVELDDNFDLVHPDHSALLGYRLTGRGFGSRWENAGWLRKTVAVADRLVVSTPALAQHYGRPGQTVVVVENALPEVAIEIAAEVAPLLPLGVPSLGWAGHVGSHVGDLEVPQGAVQETCRERGWGVWCVGDKEAALTLAGGGGLPYGSVPWEPSVIAYYRTLAQITVGVVPLVDSAFNAGKSDIKGQEFALLTGSGRAVASRVGEYARLHGPGEPVATTKNRYRDWVRALRTQTAAHVSEGPREPGERVSTARVIDPGTWWSAWTGQ